MSLSTEGGGMKALVFAYGAWGCMVLDALVREGFVVAAVVTHKDAPGEVLWGPQVKDWCSQREVPCLFDVEDEVVLSAFGAEAVFSFHYRRLLPQAVLSLGKAGAFNLHPSLLPHYRGRAPINWVLVNGEACTGVTLHHMVERADAGDIVAQREVMIADYDTAASLNDKLMREAQGMLDEVLPLIRAGSAPRRAQDISGGSYFGRRTPQDGALNWRRDAKELYNLVRAVGRPYPGAFTASREGELRVWRARMAAGHGAAGQVLSAQPLVVACGVGALEIVEWDGPSPNAGEMLT